MFSFWAEHLTVGMGVGHLVVQGRLTFPHPHGHVTWAQCTGVTQNGWHLGWMSHLTPPPKARCTGVATLA